MNNLKQVWVDLKKIWRHPASLVLIFLTSIVIDTVYLSSGKLNGDISQLFINISPLIILLVVYHFWYDKIKEFTKN